MSLERAYAWDADFRFGSELFVPVSNPGNEARRLGGGTTGIGGLPFFDRAYENGFFGFNANIERTATGESEAKRSIERWIKK